MPERVTKPERHRQLAPPRKPYLRDPRAESVGVKAPIPTTDGAAAHAQIPAQIDVTRHQPVRCLVMPLTVVISNGNVPIPVPLGGETIRGCQELHLDAFALLGGR